MSRSNPVDNSPNPATRWFKWAGGADGGFLEYYDKTAVDPKTKKEGVNFQVKDGFTFILLDETSTITGFNEQAGTGIFANEVRDTLQEPFVVKVFDKNRSVLATGLYQQIKDRVKVNGGKYTRICYVAWKTGNALLSIAGIQFHGSALQAWSEFTKACKQVQLTDAKG